MKKRNLTYEYYSMTILVISIYSLTVDTIYQFRKTNYEKAAFTNESDETIINKIYLYETKVMLDRDLAELYSVTTGN